MTVAKIDGRWQGILLFGVADAGLWTVNVTIDGVSFCQSPLTVVLPPGVTAPPTQPPAEAVEPEQSAPVIDGAAIRDAAIGTVGALVVASWIFLGAAGIAKVFGARPLARPWIRSIAVPATFLAVWGGLMAIAAFVFLIVALSHFGSGIPADEQALLGLGGGATAVVGAVLGTLAARRVGRAAPP